MKVLLKLLIIFVFASLATNSHAFPELPFCPAGGPPGWINYFNDKRDQNIWRHYLQNTAPAYRPNHNMPYNYYAPPYRYNRGLPQSRATPYRND